MKKYRFVFIKALSYLCCFCTLFSFVFSIYYFYNNNQHKSMFCHATQTSKITYAKILENCLLFKTSSMSTDISNVYFYLPQTYFVSILSNISENIIKVQYSSYIGFCYADYISVVSFTPNIAELSNITFDINQLAGTQVWSSPSDVKGIKYTTIPAGTTQIEYIASTTGDIPLGGTVSLWYYARFTPASNTTSVYEGYIYSEATNNLSNIPNNLEVETIIDNPLQENTISIDGAFKVVLIILICLPFVILFIASLVKAIKQIKSKKQTLKSEQTTATITTPKNTTCFVKKDKPKVNTYLSDNNEDLETIEVAFPQYDYIDDDDLL